MADAVTVTGGKAEMAYIHGNVPWHGLGNPLRLGAPIEEWRDSAGMNWLAKRTRVRYGEGKFARTIDDKHVLFRDDNKNPLGIVSAKYKIVQPPEVLEFFRDLTEESGFQLHTAGTLFGGQRFWALAKIGEDVTIRGADLIGQYLLLSTSVDGTLATTATPTSVCVVCNNTLSQALQGNHAQRVVINHRSVFDHAKVKADLGIATGGFKEFLTLTRKLANRPVKTATAEDFVAHLLADTKMVLPSADPVKSQQFKKIMALFGGQGMGSDLGTREGTMWGVVNAVTEYVDHHVKATSPDNKMASAWYGRGDNLKTTAMERAVALVA